tara:strand:+ start:752 stop:991 length:240 start_codon:yes stop_codon:yes gene_type:complete
MLFCPICGEEWLVYNNLCQDCRKIKHYHNLIGKEKFHKALEKLFITSEKRREKILEAEEKKEEKKKGLGVITRSQANSS